MCSSDLSLGRLELTTLGGRSEIRCAYCRNTGDGEGQGTGYHKRQRLKHSLQHCCLPRRCTLLRDVRRPRRCTHNLLYNRKSFLVKIGLLLRFSERSMLSDQSVRYATSHRLLSSAPMTSSHTGQQIGASAPDPYVNPPIGAGQPCKGTHSRAHVLKHRPQQT